MNATDPEADAVGTVLAGRFRIVSLLGRGGMASVYEAVDEALGRTVAVKLFRQELADGDDLQRQREEILLLAGLNHPALVTLFDASTSDSGSAFLVMELVSGTDLHSRLLDGPLDRSTVATIGKNLADALGHVHAQGVIHRDVKPGNILLPEHGSPGPPAKLADFGIARLIDGARLTATGTVLGTASYISPEQARGEALTPASDIYSLGLVLLECLTGERAFPGTAAESMVARLGRTPEVPQRLGSAWVGLLRGMTLMDPDARPTARDVAGALARLADAPSSATTTAVTRPYTQQLAHTVPLSADATTPRPTAPENSPRRRRPVLLGLAGAVALALVVWLAVTVGSALAPGPDASTAVEYPAVDGSLGTHLEQLQRSVEP